MNLKRTQIYLEKVHYETLRHEAKAFDISLAELVRRIVKEHLSRSGKVRRFTKDRYMSIVGIGKSGSKDISSKHDKYLGEAVASGRSY